MLISSLRFIACTGTMVLFCLFGTYHLSTISVSADTNPTPVALTILPNSLPAARVGTPFQVTLSASNQAGTLLLPQWWLVSGSLPVGMGLVSVPNNHTPARAVFLSGTPAFAGTYTFVVRMDNTFGFTAEKSYTLLVQPMAIQTTTLPPATVNTPYAYTLSAIGGYAPHRWGLSEGDVPPGMTLAYGGILEGTASVPGSYTFTASVLDEAGNRAYQPLTIQVQAAQAPAPTPAPTPTPALPALTISTTSFPRGIVGQWFGYNLAVSGGTTPYRWEVLSGTVPTGLALDPAGALYGTASAAGTFTFSLRAIDAAARNASLSYTVVIDPATAPTPTPTPTPSPTLSPSPTPNTPSQEDTNQLLTRLNNLARIGLSPDVLVKLPDDGNRNTQEDSAVYYVAQDGRRHAFPNLSVFSSWYADFSGVRILPLNDLATIPLGRNITYKSGGKMVKFTTDAKVYVVSDAHTLRPVQSESVARDLYGPLWNRQIDDISDTFYMDYVFGMEIVPTTMIDLSATRALFSSISRLWQ